MKFFSNILFSSSSKTAGKSPSSRGEIDGIKHQIKRSNSTRNWRRWFGYDPDPSDLIGEYIASKIADKLSASIYLDHELSEDAELSPKVELVLDEKKRELKLASKYLNDGAKLPDQSPKFLGGTLDEVWAWMEGKIEIAKGHAIISANPSSGSIEEENKLLKCGEKLKTTICGKKVEMTLEKKQLFQALKLSFALGDHDVNPGNMYVVYDKEKQKSQICRIDYGHAFSDLIKKWGKGRDHSPSIEPGKGVVLDALNRTKVNGGKSKLARDYRGIIPDHDFASELRKDVDQPAIREGIRECSKELDAFYKSKGNKLGRLKHKITKCFSTLSSRMGFGKMKEQDAILQKTGDFVESNLEEMKSIANLVDIQAYIEDVTNGSLSPAEGAKKIQECYAKDIKYLLRKSPSDEVEWVRTDKDESSLKCSLHEYIAKAIERNPEAKQQLSNLSSILPKQEEKRVIGKFTKKALNNAGKQEIKKDIII